MEVREHGHGSGSPKDGPLSGVLILKPILAQVGLEGTAVKRLGALRPVTLAATLQTLQAMFAP